MNRIRTRVNVALLSASIIATLVSTVPATSAASQSTPAHRLGALIPSGRLAARLPLGAAMALPSVVDHRQFAMPVRDQMQVNSCVAWTIDYALLGWYANRDRRVGQPHAPMYTYSQIRLLDSNGQDRGSYIYDALKVARDQGNDVRSNYWQGDYDWRTTPTASQRSNARNWKIQSYTTLFMGAGQGAPAIAQIKNALASGTPVVISLWARDGLMQMGHSADALDTDTSSHIYGGHAVLALGYDERGLLIQNSWGTSWGFGGYGRLGWNVVGQDVIDANVISGLLPPVPPLERNFTADVNGDQRADLVAWNDTSKWVSLSSGSAYGSPLPWQSTAFYGNRANAVGDVNGDGRADLIAWNDTSKWVSLSSGSGFGPPTPWQATPFYGSRANVIGDVTGDRRADLVAWNDDNVWVSVSTGTGFSAPTRWLTGAFYGNRGNRIGDLNGDGRADLVAWNDSSKWVALSSGGGFGSPRQWQLTPFYGTKADRVADVNGDQRADLVAWNHDSVWVSFAQPTGGFSGPTPWKFGLFYGSLTSTVGDVNADRRTDLIAWNDGSKWVSLSTATGFGPGGQWQLGWFYDA